MFKKSNKFFYVCVCVFNTIFQYNRLGVSSLLFNFKIDFFFSNFHKVFVFILIFSDLRHTYRTSGNRMLLICLSVHNIEYYYNPLIFTVFGQNKFLQILFS